MAKNTFRVVTRGANGELRIRDYPSKDSLLKLHTQIGIDDCSTDLSLEVFETLTKEWSSAKTARRSRRRTAKPGEAVQPEASAAPSQTQA
jgi:hypothetical protein